MLTKLNSNVNPNHYTDNYLILITDDHAEVFLGDNPLKCDCEMEWLQRYNSELSKSVPR